MELCNEFKWILNAVLYKLQLMQESSLMQRRYDFNEVANTMHTAKINWLLNHSTGIQLLVKKSLLNLTIDGAVNCVLGILILPRKLPSFLTSELLPVESVVLGNHSRNSLTSSNLLIWHDVPCQAQVGFISLICWNVSKIDTNIFNLANNACDVTKG